MTKLEHNLLTASFNGQSYSVYTFTIYDTVCPGSSDPLYILSLYSKLLYEMLTSSWTYGERMYIDKPV